MAPRIAEGQLAVTLIPSDYNGFQVSCFGAKDGAIDLKVTGGTPPYAFHWSTGATTEDVAGLPSGYYKVRVSDANEDVEADITLNEPLALKLIAEPFKYPGGHNISCHDCFNGSIDVTVHYGVPPYSYDWGDGVHTQDRSGLGALAYSVLVTDANACQARSEKLLLTQPERGDWAMQGNASTDPGQHYIGTADAQDVVFKSNGTERLRLTSDGDVQAGALAGSGPGLLVADEAGILKRYDDDLFPELVVGCPAHDRLPWMRCGNTIDAEEYLGTNNNRPLLIKTNAQLRMLITAQGRVGIGQASPVQQLEVTHADASGGMSLRNKLPGNAHSEIRFYQGANQRWGLGCDLNSNGGQGFFLWDEVAQVPRLFVDEQGKMGIGTMPPDNNSSLYKLYVGGGIAARDVRVTHASSWPDHVFAPDYPLLPLAALRCFVQENRHLPGIPSEKELLAEGGYEVGDMQARLLKLVEEQTLYLLELEERLSRLERPQAESAEP